VNGKSGNVTSAASVIVGEANGLPDWVKPGNPSVERTLPLSLRNRTSAALFDHLVGEQLHGNRHFQTKGLGSLEVDHELELGRLHDR